MMITGIAILILLAGKSALSVLQISRTADAPFECPVRWGKFPVPDDCSSFYNCVASNARKKKCPDGQYFDKFFKKCDKQDEVDCNSEVTAPSKITFKCPFPWGPHPYPEDCSKHYLCLFGKPSIKKCEKKMLFSAKEKKCEDEEKVDCGSRLNPYGALTSALPACDSNQRPFLVDGSNCKEYYICVKGQLHKKVCPNRQRFDTRFGFCDWEELVPSCRSPISSFCQTPNGQFVKRGSNCKNYVDCKNGIAVEKVCPSGELFDEELGKCEWSEIVDCNEKDPLCPVSNGIFMVKGAQCKSYIVCKKGKASIHVCPADRLFNKEIKNCDWPELVYCNEEEITVTDRITTVSFRSTSDFRTKATPQQPLTISLKQTTGPTPLQLSTVSTIKVTEPTPQQKTTFLTTKITKPTPQQPSTVPSVKITKSTSQQPLTVPSTQPTPQQPSTVSSTEPTVQQQSTVLTLKITKPTSQQPSTVRSTEPTPQQPSTVPSMKITKPTSQQPSIVPSTEPTAQQQSTVPTQKITKPTLQQPSTVPLTQPTPQQPSTVPSTEPTVQQQSTVPTLKITKPTPQQPSIVPSTEPTPQHTSTISTMKITKPTSQQPSTVSSTTIFKQPSTISTEKITKVAPISTTSTLPSITQSSQLTSIMTSEQLTTPIKTSVAMTNFHSILPTTSSRVTTSIHTSQPLSEKSTISPLISSTVFNLTSTPINTSFSKSWTNPQEISTDFSTTPNNIALSHSTSHKSLSTSQTPSETTTISIPKTSSKDPEPITDSSFLTTPRGCTFGDESCEPDEVLCPGEFGEFPHPDTPFYFVHCDHWRPYIKKCPHELHFDPELKVCAWPK